MRTDIPLTIITKGIQYLSDLFNNKLLEKGLKIDIDKNTSIEIDSYTKQMGMTGTEVFISLIVSLEAGLIHTLLVDKLKDNSKIIIKDTSTDIVIKQDDLEVHFEKYWSKKEDDFNVLIRISYDMLKNDYKVLEEYDNLISETDTGVVYGVFDVDPEKESVDIFQFSNFGALKKIKVGLEEAFRKIE